MTEPAAATTSSTPPATPPRERALPERARVVVVGGGVIGCSVAYHLTQLGWTDVVVLEQGTLSCGTTWHAAGLVGQLRASEAGTRLVQYSTELYARLEAETGLATGYRVCGGLTVARTPERMVQLRRTVASAAAYDLDCELLTPDQALERYPAHPGRRRARSDLAPRRRPGQPDRPHPGAGQGRADGRRHDRRAGPRHRCRPPSRGRRRGRCRTDQGDIEAEVVVNCAGQWAKAVGALAGVTVPLHSAEHFYVVTDQIEGVHRDLPILRDPDGYTYVKEEVGGLLVGGFEPVAKPWVSPDQIPYPFEFALLDEDWEHFEVLMDSAVHRIPVLAETGIRKFYNGPESFTPGQPVPPRRGARAARLLRGGRLQLGRDRVGGRRRPGARRVDRRGRADDRPDRRRHPAVLPAGGQQRLAAGAGRRGARACTTPCRGPTASSSRRGRSAGRRCTTCSSPRAPASAAATPGSGPMSLRPKGVRRSSTTLGAPALGRLVGRRAARHPRGGGGLRPDVVLQVPRRRDPTPSAPCSGSAPPMSTCPSAGRSTRRCSTRAAPTRPTSP